MSQCRKRKADVLGRVETSSRLGRGSLSGWTTCPLCPAKRLKKYALGRGISAHLWAIHTPWKKGARKKKNKSLKRRRKNEEEGEISTDEECWEPTREEEDAWAEKVAQIAAKIEQEQPMKVGVDRTGKATKSYRESIPPFIRAAADGDMKTLQQMIDQAKQAGNLLELLCSRDRNGSISEHWASGGGHLECLKMLLRERDKISEAGNDNLTATLQKSLKLSTEKKSGRRDGKTCLHYAARNGQLSCIHYLIEERKEPVDPISGDGTTPFHLACYNGSPTVVQYLIEKGADVYAVNNWSCGASHWVAMTTSKKDDQVISLCTILHKSGVSFVKAQKQGHTALHKAAQKGNRCVIQWMAKSAANGGPGLSESERKKQVKLTMVGICLVKFGQVSEETESLHNG